jgi:hypothetical protein
LPRTVTIRLSDDSYEWLRRYAHWEQTTMADVLRTRLEMLASETGYLRPPDDEPQDFGDEKGQMQWLVTIQEERK